MTIQPTANHILIEFVPPMDKSDSNLLHLPQTAQKESQQAIIVAAGPGKPDKPMPFTVGQRIMIRRFFDMAITNNGKNLRFADADDVIAVLTEDVVTLAS